jgi:YesN/AraC family two-component response regulator
MYGTLIVDDNVTERNGLSSALTNLKMPIAIEKAENGQAALEIITNNGKRFHILITDIKMPYMDGLTLSVKAKELLPDLIVIIISAYDDYEFMQKAIKARVDDYLLKPVILKELYAVFENAVDILNTRTQRAEPCKQELCLKNPNHRIINEVIQLIDSNLHLGINIDWLAEKVYLSSAYLGSIFTRETGKSILQYITMSRMNKARNLLCETNKKINDICSEVGYDNPSYFGFVFRKFFGVTPLKMRENSNGNAHENFAK